MPEEADKHDARQKMGPGQAGREKGKVGSQAWTNCGGKVSVGARGKKKYGAIKFSWQGGNTCS